MKNTNMNCKHRKKKFGAEVCEYDDVDCPDGFICADYEED